MLMNFPLITRLAFLYVRSTHAHTALRSMLYVCFLSMSIASGALVLINGIVRGFTTATQQQLQGPYPPLVIEAPVDAELNLQALREFITTKHNDSVTALAPTSL